MTQETDQILAEVIRVLNQYGIPMSFLRTSEGTYDPTTASADEPITAMYSGMGYPWPYLKYERSNSLIEKNQSRLIVHKVETLPMVGDQVSYRDFTYRITNVDLITMSNEDMAYLLDVTI